MASLNKRMLLKYQLYLMLSLVALRRKREQKHKKRRKHRFWVRKLFTNRYNKGAFNTLVAELRLHDREFFYRYLRT